MALIPINSNNDNKDRISARTQAEHLKPHHPAMHHPTLPDAQPHAAKRASKTELKLRARNPKCESLGTLPAPAPEPRSPQTREKHSCFFNIPQVGAGPLQTPKTMMTNTNFVVARPASDPETNNNENPPLEAPYLQRKPPRAQECSTPILLEGPGSGSEDLDLRLPGASSSNLASGIMKSADAAEQQQQPQQQQQQLQAQRATKVHCDASAL